MKEKKVNAVTKTLMTKVDTKYGVAMILIVAIIAGTMMLLKTQSVQRSIEGYITSDNSSFTIDK